MRPRLTLLTKLLVLVALFLASLPAGATETVCIVGQAKPVQVAKCDMPCCAKPAPIKRVCCAPKKTSCTLAKKSCRCEIRLVATPPARVTTVNSKLALPAALLPTPFEAPQSQTLLQQEPGIVGLDSGPPPKLKRSPSQPRAPPVSV